MKDDDFDVHPAKLAEGQRGLLMGLTWLFSSGASVNAMAALVANESSRVSPGQVRSVFRFRVASELYGCYLTVQVTLQPRLQGHAR